jgi:hypothetical protein
MDLEDKQLNFFKNFEFHKVENFYEEDEKEG